MPRSSTRHGDHQRYHTGKWSTNRYGVISGSTQFHNPEEFEQPQWRYLSVAAAPPAIVPCVNAERVYDPKVCMAIYTYSYEGISDQVTFEDRIFCTLEGSDSEEPIETHPNFQELYKKYKGVRDSQGRFVTFKYGVIDTDQGQVFNPLYGVDHFLTLGLIWTRTRVVASLPQGVISRVDCIDSPAGFGGMQPPRLKGKRNWLKLAPAAQQRSNYINLAERWMASGRNGWNSDIYNEKTSF